MVCSANLRLMYLSLGFYNFTKRAQLRRLNPEMNTKQWKCLPHVRLILFSLAGLKRPLWRPFTRSSRKKNNLVFSTVWHGVFLVIFFASTPFKDRWHDLRGFRCCFLTLCSQVFSLGLFGFLLSTKANIDTRSVTALPLYLFHFIYFYYFLVWQRDVFLTFDLFTASFDSSPNERFRLAYYRVFSRRI